MRRTGSTAVAADFGRGIPGVSSSDWRRRLAILPVLDRGAPGVSPPVTGDESRRAPRAL